MIDIPLSQIGSTDSFAKDIEAHRTALIAHQQSENVAIPVHSQWVDQVISRRPQTGPVAQRGADEFVVLPYQVIDDTPRTPEAELAVKVLRETISR